VLVAVAVAVDVRVGVASGLVGVAVGVSVGMSVGVRVGVGVAMVVPVAVGVGLGGCRTAPQKPPITAYVPPLMLPASGWPAVPPRLWAPPVLNVAPPPSMVLRLRS
jgi:hypothetical protein